MPFLVVTDLTPFTRMHLIFSDFRNMAAHVSGVVWSSLCFEQTDSPGDNEGLLLGQVVSHITDHISDSQLNNVKEETVTYIHGHIPCHGTFSWYDSSGQVKKDKLRQLLPKDEHKTVIGWYKCRRHSSLTVSLRERAVHRSLKEYFSKIDPQNFLFVLFTCSANQKLSTHSFDHLIMSHNGRQFQRLSLQISNLKETSHGGYKLQGNPVASPNSSGFNKAFSAYQNEFYEKNGELRDVANIRHLNSTMHKQLREMGLTIMGQEHDLHQLTSEIQALQDRLNSKLALKAQSNTGSSQMMGSSSRGEAKKSDEGKGDQPLRSEVKKPSYLNTAKKQPAPSSREALSAATQQRAAAPGDGAAAAPSNGPSRIRDDLKDLFVLSPSPSADEAMETQVPKTSKTEMQVPKTSKTETQVPKTSKTETQVPKASKKLPVGEGEEDKTPLLQPVQLHAKTSAKPSNESKSDSKDPKRPTDVGKSSTSSGKQCNENDKSTEKGTKDAFDFLGDIIRLESPVDKENTGIKGKVAISSKTGAAEDNNRTSKTKSKTTNTSTKKDTGLKDSGCHIRELSASPSRAMTRERSEISPNRALKPQGRSTGASSTQQKGARSRSGSRGRGAKQSSSPTF